MTLPAEFQLIQHFSPLAAPEGLGLLDDAAIFRPPPGRDLVVSADAIVEGVHFLPSDPPDLVARKLLRVNLSDLAAMGATPLHYLLTVSVPRGTGHDWFANFAAGLVQDQNTFGVTLLGGDTTSTPGPISLSATIIGHIAPGAALRRAGARAGDELFVSGTIGDGALGLLALRGEIPDPDGALASRYHLPQPRLGLSLHGIVSACMDVSDGLLQDAGHLARASGLGVVIQENDIPLSPAARAAIGAISGHHNPDRLNLCLTGGDDYELLMAVLPIYAPQLRQEFEAAGVQVTRVGRFGTEQSGVTLVRADGSSSIAGTGGWSHF